MVSGRTVSIAVIHPRVGVTVRVDEETWADWRRSGRSVQWFWEAGVTRFRDTDGKLRPVIDAILGEPACFQTDDTFSLTLSNLRPQA